MIPYGKQDIRDIDIESVIEVLRSDFLTQGPKVEKFEENISSKINARHSVAVNSATSALHVACMALDLSDGDIFWTSPITFVASANCGLYCRAKVDFVDIDPLTFNISPSALEAKLIKAKKLGTLPKILIVVHLCGLSADMAKIYNLSKIYGFKIIEDGSHAIGGKYKNQYIGSCKFSDITIFSFHPVKIITAGEGGVAVTNDTNLAIKMKSLRSHGITRDDAHLTQSPHGSWYYEQLDLGFNYRMTDLHAALGISQLTRLDTYVSKRHEIATTYIDFLKDLPISFQYQPKKCYSSYHLFVIRINKQSGSVDRNDIFQLLREAGIAVNVHYIPVHMQPYFAQFGFKKNDYPNSVSYYNEAISLPMFPTLSNDDQMHVIESLKGIF
jgi:UDP-4-amino-4,6-dideoxy-N-acetyl-beta-L-altrosamine transaminase